MDPRPDLDFTFGQPLRPRERQLAWKLANEAKKNKELATDLGVTEGSIKVYLHRIYRKTGVRTRTELLLWVAQNPELARPPEILWPKPESEPNPPK